MKNLWIAFEVMFILSFTVLLWIFSKIFRAALPIPREVVTSGDKVLSV